MDLKAIDMFEINEAFASQAFAVRRDLGLDPDKVNIYGGGISIGHPIGATGVILAVKVLYELQRTGKKDAMGSMVHLAAGRGSPCTLGQKTDTRDLKRLGLKSSNTDFSSGFNSWYQSFVKYMEIPCPPPMHMLTMASFLSVRCSS